MKSSKKIMFNAECDGCGGTGLYRGFMEGPGHAVVCTNCAGTGCATVRLKPFEGRKRKNGIKKVRFGSGLIADNFGESVWFSYKDFLEKVPTTPNCKKKIAKRKKVKK